MVNLIGWLGIAHMCQSHGLHVLPEVVVNIMDIMMMLRIVNTLCLAWTSAPSWRCCRFGSVIPVELYQQRVPCCIESAPNERPVPSQIRKTFFSGWSNSRACVFVTQLQSVLEFALHVMLCAPYWTCAQALDPDLQDFCHSHRRKYAKLFIPGGQIRDPLLATELQAFLSLPCM